MRTAGPCTAGGCSRPAGRAGGLLPARGPGRHRRRRRLGRGAAAAAGKGPEPGRRSPGPGGRVVAVSVRGKELLRYTVPAWLARLGARLFILEYEDLFEEPAEGGTTADGKGSYTWERDVMAGLRNSPRRAEGRERGAGEEEGGGGAAGGPPGRSRVVEASFVDLLPLLLIFLLYSVAFVATTFPREEIPAVMDGVDALM